MADDRWHLEGESGWWQMTPGRWEWLMTDDTWKVRVAGDRWHLECESGWWQMTPGRWEWLMTDDTWKVRVAGESGWWQMSPGRWEWLVTDDTFTLYCLADLFNQTRSRLLWEAFSHAAINSQWLFVNKYSPLSIARYSIILLSELEQCRVKKRLQGFT